MSEPRVGRRWRDEPLLWFAVVGASLFVIDRARPHEDEARRIVVDEAFVEGLRTEATRRTGHAPTEEETRALVEGWAREEALYREARARGLDAGDTIVRRRLVQKIELALAAEAPIDEPTEAELEAYLAAHADRFAAPARTSVTTCFFARELHEDARALAEAHVAAPEGACDPALAGTTFRERTDAQLAAIVGDDATAALASVAIGAWAGPFETPRGVYAVRVDDRSSGGPRALADVREPVRAALVDERRTAAVAEAERAIAARYEVVRL